MLKQTRFLYTDRSTTRCLATKDPISSAFIVDLDGIVRRKSATKLDPVERNYRARVNHMQTQATSSLIAGLNDSWCQVFQSHVLYLPTEASRLHFFAPDPFAVSSTAASRDLLHGWLATRTAWREVHERSPLSLDPVGNYFVNEFWFNVCDRRGFSRLFGEDHGREKVKSKRDFPIMLQSALGPVYTRWTKPYPASMCSVTILNQEFKHTDPLPAHISSLVIWEMFEMNHRAELRAMDRLHFHGDYTALLFRREALLKRCFSGHTLLPDISNPVDGGLSASTLHRRRPYVIALITVMRDWIMDGQPVLPANLERILHCKDLPYHDSSPRGGSQRPDHLWKTQEAEVLLVYSRVCISKLHRAPVAPRTWIGDAHT